MFSFFYTTFVGACLAIWLLSVAVMYGMKTLKKRRVLRAFNAEVLKRTRESFFLHAHNDEVMQALIHAENLPNAASVHIKVLWAIESQKLLKEF